MESADWMAGMEVGVVNRRVVSASRRSVGRSRWLGLVGLGGRWGRERGGFLRVVGLFDMVVRAAW